MPDNDKDNEDNEAGEGGSWGVLLAVPAKLRVLLRAPLVSSGFTFNQDGEVTNRNSNKSRRRLRNDTADSLWHWDTGTSTCRHRKKFKVYLHFLRKLESSTFFRAIIKEHIKRHSAK